MRDALASTCCCWLAAAAAAEAAVCCFAGEPGRPGDVMVAFRAALLTVGCWSCSCIRGCGCGLRRTWDGRDPEPGGAVLEADITGVPDEIEDCWLDGWA